MKIYSRIRPRKSQASALADISLISRLNRRTRAEVESVWGPDLVLDSAVFETEEPQEEDSVDR